MNDALLHPAVAAALAELDIAHEALPCDAELADTALFCERYGHALEDSANALLVGSTRGEPVHALCVALATTRLDVNRVVRKRLGVRRLSFVDPALTRALTGMELGGVTPFGLPAGLPLWIDARVMGRERVVLGGGNRTSKLVVAPGALLRAPGAEVVEGLAKGVGTVSGAHP